MFPIDLLCNLNSNSNIKDVNEYPDDIIICYPHDILMIANDAIFCYPHVITNVPIESSMFDDVLRIYILVSWGHLILYYADDILRIYILVSWGHLMLYYTDDVLRIYILVSWGHLILYYTEYILMMFHDAIFCYPHVIIKATI